MLIVDYDWESLILTYAVPPCWKNCQCRLQLPSFMAASGFDYAAQTFTFTAKQSLDCDALQSLLSCRKQCYFPIAAMAKEKP